jgi:hypothetical protein
MRSCGSLSIADEGRYEPAANGERSIRNRQVHARRVVENAAAICAGDEFLAGLAGYHNLGGHAHMTTAANAMLDSHNDIMAFAPQQPFVPGAGAFVDRLTQLSAVGFEIGQFFPEIVFAVVQLRKLIVHELFCRFQSLGVSDNISLGRLASLH